eukprot:gnl/TRDRNA2_/TRDRNA2_134407_c0_seq1.p1 gnl/TRDRNA2_/TRDRNA2_134407_c0~~gnl/TRDRNA2_/TRDRNA2_134407_c0_seq1.p1  ORF type:complete len:878 (-),score=149.72 gnl/TRDRNA2_/TRDRNA2_134407_c0_seq1:76-2709(-)
MVAMMHGEAAIHPHGHHGQHHHEDMHRKSTSMEIKEMQLSLVIKIDAGDFDELLLEDVQGLFQVLDTDDSGYLDKAEISRMFREVLELPCSDGDVNLLFQCVDVHQMDGKIGADELLMSLRHGPFRDHLESLWRVRQAELQYEEAKEGGHQTLERDLMLEKFAWRVNRDDSFRTLPFTLLYTCVYLALTVQHLQVWRRQQVQRGLENWMIEYGEHGEGWLEDYVGTYDNMWGWLELSGLGAVLDDCRNSNDSSGMPYWSCHMASRNVLVGDIRLHQIRDGDVHVSEWLLNSAEAQLHLSQEEGDFKGAATARLTSLVDAGWADSSTELFELIFMSYNQRNRMFAITRATLFMYSSGFVVQQVVSRAVMIDQYPHEWRVDAFPFDLVFVWLTLWPTYSETKELISRVWAGGCRDGCVGYWGFWNMVDWTTICFGFANIALWSLYCLATQVEPIQALLGPDMSLTPYAMTLTADQLDEIGDALDHIISVFFGLQLAMGFHSLSIMLKFFKAFQANPRLQVVTNTMIKASGDILHFGIVFVAIFVGFSASGHVFFGDDIIEFNSLGRSIDTSFRVLLGEFEWYNEWARGDTHLGSGMPYALLCAWFWLYMIFVLLILLNMLLAIIMEHYANQTAIVNAAADAPTLYKQSLNFIQRARKTKGFIPLLDLLTALEDSDNPAHEANLVTKESLMEAFAEMKMTDKQAVFIVEWLTKEAHNKAMGEVEADNILLLNKLGAQVTSLSEQLRTVTLSSSLAASRLQGLEQSVSSMKGKIEEIEGGTGAGISNDNEVLAKLDALAPAISEMLQSSNGHAANGNGSYLNVNVGFESGGGSLAPFDFARHDTRKSGRSSKAKLPPAPTVCCQVGGEAKDLVNGQVAPGA